MEHEARWCILCGPSAGKKIKFESTVKADSLTPSTFSARRTPDRVHFRLVTCENCGLVFSDPACSAADLERLYNAAEVRYAAQEEEIFASYAPLLDHAITRLPRRGTFVEIGGGSGFMLRYGVQRHFTGQVEVDPSNDGARQFVAPAPTARFVTSTFQRGILAPASASMACFFQVLDHAPDPLDFVRTVHEVLEDGGVAVAVTHDSDALSAHLLGERSPIYDAAHTYLFNRKNLELLFRKAGFTDVHVMPVSNTYRIAHWVNLAPLPHMVRQVAQGALSAVGLDRVRLPLYAGNVAAIAYKSV